MGKHKQNTDGQTEAQDIERYQKLQQEGHHKLPYKEYLRAKELGIELPEADPVYEVGAGVKRPVAVVMPKGFPLERCYRVTRELIQETYVDGDNAHLLAALGQLEEPLVPVWIPEQYDGYSWAKLPTVESVDVTLGEPLHGAGFGGTTGLGCVESIVLTAHTSDGKTHSGHVCLAVDKPIVCCTGGSQVIFVTPEARTRLHPMDVLHYLGLTIDDPVNAARAIVMLDDFWLLCNSDEEALRLAIMDHLEMLVSGWQSITRTEAGVVTIRYPTGRAACPPGPRRETCRAAPAPSGVLPGAGLWRSRGGRLSRELLRCGIEPSLRALDDLEQAAVVLLELLGGLGTSTRGGGPAAMPAPRHPHGPRRLGDLCGLLPRWHPRGLGQAMQEAVAPEPDEESVSEVAVSFQEMEACHDQQQASLEDIVQQAMPEIEEVLKEEEDPWELYHRQMMDPGMMGFGPMPGP